MKHGSSLAGSGGRGRPRKMIACLRRGDGRVAVAGATARRGQATPMTYVWGARQYVVIYAGGHSRGLGRLGDVVMAFGVE